MSKIYSCGPEQAQPRLLTRQSADDNIWPAGMTNLGQEAGKNRAEAIVRGTGKSARGLPPAVRARVYASSLNGARGLSPAAAVLVPGLALDCHFHDCGEAITVLEGTPTVLVQSRSHKLQGLDCVFVPPCGTRSVRNAAGVQASLHSAFVSASPARNFLEPRALPGSASREDNSSVAEAVTRFAAAPGYELAPGTDFHDLFRGAWTRPESAAGTDCLSLEAVSLVTSTSMTSRSQS